MSEVIDIFTKKKITPFRELDAISEVSCAAMNLLREMQRPKKSGKMRVTEVLKHFKSALSAPFSAWVGAKEGGEFDISLKIEGSKFKEHKVSFQSIGVFIYVSSDEFEGESMVLCLAFNGCVQNLVYEAMIQGSEPSEGESE